MILGCAGRHLQCASIVALPTQVYEDGMIHPSDQLRH
jgi:hypothetical protein